MHGDRPYVQFNPDNRVFWAYRTGLPPMEDAEVGAAYQRALGFINERVKKLVDTYKWREIDIGSTRVAFNPNTDDLQLIAVQMLLSLSGRGYINRFSIPNTFFSFLNPSKFNDWRLQFEIGVFDAAKPSSVDNDFYISGPSALSDIFYLLQSLAPGMLVIAEQISETDDTADMEWIRALPKASWVVEHADDLKRILGSTDAYEALLDASRDPERSFTITWSSPWNDDSDSDCRSTGSRKYADYWDETDYDLHNAQVVGKLAACGSECGICSRGGH